MAKKEITITQDESAPIAPEVVAKSIVQIDEAIRKLKSSPLKDGALYLLIRHSCSSIDGRRPTIREIKTVIEGIEYLKRQCLKPTNGTGRK